MHILKKKASCSFFTILSNGNVTTEIYVNYT